jgi:hypothetical protein
MMGARATGEPEMTSAPDARPAAERSRAASLLRWPLWIVAGLALFVWFAWTALTLWFSNLESAGMRQLLTGGYVLVLAAALLVPRPSRRGVLVALGASLVVALVYLATRPSNERDWLPDVAVAPTIELDGERVTVRGVRNFRYRSDTDFDARWEDRSYDLSALRTLDLVMSYWGPTDYCHTFLSFGFDGGEQLAVSVETRKEVGETYSALAGFFKRYELIYVFGDERDLIGARAGHRGEEVYLYRLRVLPDRLRELFLSYVGYANRLAAAPEFYGVIRNSCGVNILHRVADTGRTVFVGRDALLNGTWDRGLYAQGALDRSLSFAELRERSRIDGRARAALDAPDFSRRIRAELPGPPSF